MTNELITLSDCDLATATGGQKTANGKLIFNAAEADRAKRQLDQMFGFSLKDPGRAVARRVPGHPDQFTVETPRLDGHGRRYTV